MKDGGWGGGGGLQTTTCTCGTQGGGGGLQTAVTGCSEWHGRHSALSHTNAHMHLHLHKKHAPLSRTRQRGDARDAARARCTPHRSRLLWSHWHTPLLPALLPVPFSPCPSPPTPSATSVLGSPLLRPTLQFAYLLYALLRHGERPPQARS